MFLTGKVINNRYEVLEQIGKGGMSVVWKAKDNSNGNIVATKTLKRETTSNRIDDIIRFRNEANTINNTVENFRQLIKFSDDALYMSNNNRRNRTTIYINND